MTWFICVVCIHLLSKQERGSVPWRCGGTTHCGAFPFSSWDIQETLIVKKCFLSLGKACWMIDIDCP